MAKIDWSEFDRWVDEKVGPDANARDLAMFAQKMDVIADSYGGTDGRYEEADRIWGRAFEAAEREGGALEMERLARENSWITPTAREADLAQERDDGFGWGL